MKKITLIIAFLVATITTFAQFNKGTKVLIDYQGQWYPGKVLEVKGQNAFLVSYDDYDASWNEEVTSSRLKLNEINGNTPKTVSLKTNTPDINSKVSGEKKATEMCDCLNKMMKTQKQEDKSRCLNMQEEHVAALGKGSAEYSLYQKLVNQCEKEISNAKLSSGSASGKAPVTYEEKIKAVCDCFKEAKTDRGKTPECFKKQSDFSKTVGDKKTDFIQTTNSCQ